MSAGAYVRGRAPLLAGLALAACALVACEARVSVTGGGCTRTSDCVAPMACVAGRCGSECDTARDCGSQGRCVLTAGIGRCLLDSIDQCPDGTCGLPDLVCRAGRCYNVCDACTSDTMCVDAICVLPTDAGTSPDL